MVYRRGPRLTWTFQGRTRRGWRQVATGTPHKPLARDVERMWHHLADRERAWDVLDRVPGTLSALALLDHYRAARGRVEGVRARLADVALADAVDRFAAWYATQVRSGESVTRAVRHARWLATRLPVLSACTPDALRDALAAFPASAATQRIVHASWTTFLRYVAGDGRDLMAHVTAPPVARPAFRLVGGLADVVRIIEAQPTPERRAFFALLYGAAQDVTPALATVGGDLAPDRTLRVWGTKARGRDRTVRLDEWAVPYVWPVLRACLPGARAWHWHRRTVSAWHAETLAALGLPAVPLRNARHWWAVYHLRDLRWPVRRVQHQLGHATAKLTLDTYGAWLVDVVAEDDAAVVPSVVPSPPPAREASGA